MEMLTSELREETGAASQDLRGRPLSAGQITFSVAILETLAPIPAPEAIEVSDVDVDGFSQEVDDITPTP
jgi:AMMECR1 domain-containing protein